MKSIGNVKSWALFFGAFVLVICFVFSKVGESKETQQPLRFAQGWTQQDTETMYHIYHGSQVMPYRWFMALELSNNKKLSDNLGAYGAIESPTSQLPAGVSVADDGDTEHLYGEKKWVGFNCVACHTTALKVGQKEIVIEGGPSQFDIQKFESDLIRSVQLTLEDQQKLSKFAAALDETDLSSLKSRLQNFSDEFSERFNRNHHFVNKDQKTVAYGPGRMDGLGGAANDVICHLTDRMGDEDLNSQIKNPANCKSSQPPSSIPFIWGMTQVQFTMWDGTVHSAIGRNYGASTAAYGKNWITKDSSSNPRFRSTTNIETLYKIERIYDRLKAPSWTDVISSGIVPAFDNAKMEASVKAGETLYNNNCASCHSEIPTNSSPNFFGNSYWEINITPLAKVATDEEYLTNNLTRMATLPEMFVGPFKESFGNNSVKENNQVLATAYRSFVIGRMILGDFDANKTPLFERARLTNCRNNSLRQTEVGYRGRSLEGVGFTAPYLHNGSVPTLDDLFKPANERPKTFYVGCKDYDLNKMGFVCGADSPNAFLFETALSGNSNAGHEYGTQLDEQQRSDLIEYIKRIKTPEAAQPKNSTCN